MARVIHRTKPSAQAGAEEDQTHPLVKYIMIVFLCLMLPVLVLHLTNLDVRLRMHAGEMVGSASVGQVNSHDPDIVHSVEGLRFQPSSGSMQEFTPEQFSDGGWEQIKSAVESRGVDPKERRLQEEARYFHQPEAILLVGRSQNGFGPKTEPELPCRLHYAGFGRTVVYKWEELSPQDFERPWHR